MLDKGWSCWQHVIVGVLTLALNTKVATVEVLFLAQPWSYNYAPTVDFEKTHADRL